MLMIAVRLKLKLKKLQFCFLTISIINNFFHEKHQKHLAPLKILCIIVKVNYSKLKLHAHCYSVF